ncbi:STAS domain-containing protein [Gracilibacillus caseinilyticus]|uniref:STAS domain-containing protein n=1 Tax=Gracilibacillus caseinilyticus TaxID=2932256 RepID=A0ABY4F6A2_9BACI|nr:STAS domain-containing protein [Gracilibacillus caseinilyticus]UOQ49976.1 STAS domain-containing protein [Gracilibacillus caseinilyticus]
MTSSSCKEKVSHWMKKKKQLIVSSLIEHDQPEQLTVFLQSLIYLISKKIPITTNQAVLNNIKEIGYKKGHVITDQRIFLQMIDHFPYISAHIIQHLLEEKKWHNFPNNEYDGIRKTIDEIILFYNAGFIHGYLDSHHESLPPRSDNKHVKDLPVPIIKVDDDIDICPLIGTLDDNKTTLLINMTIQHIAETKMDYVIFDFTGITTVTDSGIYNLFYTVQLMELIGLTIIFTGIRSQSALHSSLLSQKLKDKQVFQTVKDALESLNKNHETG